MQDLWEHCWWQKMDVNSYDNVAIVLSTWAGIKRLTNMILHKYRNVQVVGKVISKGSRLNVETDVITLAPNGGWNLSGRLDWFDLGQEQKLSSI